MVGYPGCQNLSFWDRDLGNRARNFIDDHSSLVTKGVKLERWSSVHLGNRTVSHKNKTGLTFSIVKEGKIRPAIRADNLRGS